jgi:uncharacterized protein (DUF3084 family)
MLYLFRMRNGELWTPSSSGSSLRHWPPGTDSSTVRAVFFCARSSEHRQAAKKIALGPLLHLPSAAPLFRLVKSRASEGIKVWPESACRSSALRLRSSSAPLAARKQRSLTKHVADPRDEFNGCVASIHLV